MRLYEDAKRFFPKVNFRYYIAPSENLSLIPMNFDREHLERIIKVGEQDALKALELGEGVYGDVLLELANYLQNPRATTKVTFEELLLKAEALKSSQPKI